MSVNKDIERLFGMPPSNPTSGSLVKLNELVPAETGDDQDADFELARSNLLEMMKNGRRLFEQAMEYTEQANSGRAFEVTTALMRSLTDMSKDLLELHNKRQQLEKRRQRQIDLGEHEPGTVINNNIDKAVFVGTTADLLDHLNGPARPLTDLAAPVAPRSEG